MGAGGFQSTFLNSNDQWLAASLFIMFSFQRLCATLRSLRLLNGKRQI